MKIIDLLNKIANDEDLPKKIAYSSYEFRFSGGTYIDTDGDSIVRHIFIDLSNLNDEIEIIEEDKKIEKFKIYDNSIDWCCNGRAINDTEKDIMDKINEIIEAINERNL